MKKSFFCLLAGAPLALGTSAYARHSEHHEHRHSESILHSTGDDMASELGLRTRYEPVQRPPAAEKFSDHPDMNHPGIDRFETNHAEHGAFIRTPIPEVTATDRIAAFPVLHPHAMEHGQTIHYFVRFDRLEVWDAAPGTGQAWEGRAWVGDDLQRLWLRSDGERNNGRTESSNLEAFYGHSVTPWWDALIGIRQDFLPFRSQTWAAIGMQGMAPYKFEIAATAYFSESGHAAATIETEYELLLTQRLILQPSLEATLFLKQDPRRHRDNGLSAFETGLRLRYEITRRIAPYIGIVHERRFGTDPSPIQRNAGYARDTRWVTGLRFWF